MAIISITTDDHMKTDGWSLIKMIHIWWTHLRPRPINLSHVNNNLGNLYFQFTAINQFRANRHQRETNYSRRTRRRFEVGIERQILQVNIIILHLFSFQLLLVFIFYLPTWIIFQLQFNSIQMRAHIKSSLPMNFHQRLWNIISKYQKYFHFSLRLTQQFRVTSNEIIESFVDQMLERLPSYSEASSRRAKANFSTKRMTKSAATVRVVSLHLKFSQRPVRCQGLSCLSRALSLSL